MIAIPFGHWHNNTLLAAMSGKGMFAPLMLDGPLDGPVFPHRVENMLTGEPSEGDVVICYNVPVRKVAGVHEALA